MLTRSRITSILATAPLYLFSLSLPAADFTFHVPVDVSDIAQDAATEGRVFCAVHAGSGSSTQTLAQGQQLFSLNNNGALEDTLTVSINANPGVDPLAATTWECVLQFRAQDGGNNYDNGAGLVSPIQQRRAGGTFRL